ncbi:MAG: DEAD/DEAH box helicase [Planctomycetota bacterium]
MVHANFADGALHIWGECAPGSEDAAQHSSEPDTVATHPGVAPPDVLHDVMRELGVDFGAIEQSAIQVRLPATGGLPLPSPKLAHWSGHDAHDTVGAVLEPWTVATARIAPNDVPRVLSELEDLGRRAEAMLFEESSGHEREQATHAVAGESIRFFAVAARFAQALLAEERFVPTIIQEREGPLRGAWEPWLHDEAIAERTSLLLAGMPPIARAVEDEHAHDAASVLHGFLCSIVDAQSRRALGAEQMEEAIEDWEVDGDPHVGWLSGLLGTSDDVLAPAPARADMVRSVRQWLGGLDERGGETPWRLALRLNEPVTAEALPQFSDGADLEWLLSFHLQSLENDRLIVDAEDVWALRGDSASVDGHRIDSPQELLLAELGRASRLYKPLESAMEEASPIELELSTTKAYQFLREVAPILMEQGIGVIVPEWWDSPSARLGARLSLSDESEQAESGTGSAPSGIGEARLGLNALVSYQWRLAVGDSPLSLEDFERIAAQRAPLVHIDGKWVEIRREDIDQALAFIRENPGGEMRVGDALRMAYATDLGGGAISVLGVDAEGWVADLLDRDAGGKSFEMLEPPARFHGTLRPYQLKGLSWLVFLDRLGLGPCLADDMGLGKTIQLLALLVHEREEAQRAAGQTNGEATGTDLGIEPTLIIVPMSIVGNWVREVKRFAPELKVLVHHGVERLQGDSFFKTATSSDIVVTTYALANRDRELLECLKWRRVVLDEAQNIKNPSAKQSQAVRALDTTRRVALTGTPLENRLSELWSIIDFCNPGFLGTAGEFRRTFSVPVERYRDKHRAQQLRQLVRPFILRRLKTDPTVISDLPEKLETKEFCRLSSEQAEMYESCVKSMLGEVEKSEGIRRRGVVLTTLIRLKQICNHPGLVARDQDEAAAGATAAAPTRSGKCIRLLEMLDEVIASGDQALVFTQFRQMGHLLASMVRHAFDREALFLHGGTPQKQREKMIDRFQKGDGTTPVFILSLKAGGVGLNLTAASHVFHFDRWWNPAVENQATDRAFRIGQTKTVNVHKFVVSGTLEERIDQMIESKIALAEDVIGSGEDWLTELDVTALREALELRPDAVAED